MDKDMKQGESDHWLVRPRTIRRLWWAGGGILLLTVVAQIVIPIEGYFGIDGLPAFGAAYGFASCLLMVLFAKGLGLLLKRREDYYAAKESVDD